MVYNMIYLDGGSGRSMAKRFSVTGITRDKEYDLTKGAKGSKVLYFTPNPNGEAELVTVYLTAASSARKKIVDFDFASIDIKGRSAGGNIVSRYPVRKVQLKAAGKSTLGGMDIWYDESIGRLNTDDRGSYLGNFKAEDQIIVLYKEGSYEITGFELTNRYESQQVLSLAKFEKDLPVAAIHYESGQKVFYVKRFLVETTSVNKRFPFISDTKGSRLLFATQQAGTIQVTYRIKSKHHTAEYVIEELIEPKGWKAMGNKFPVQNLVKVEMVKTEKQEESPIDLEELKNEVRQEVEDEDHQLGLFGEKDEEE